MRTAEAEMGSEPRVRRPWVFALGMAVMAIVYFLASDKMLTSRKFREAILPSLGSLAGILRPDWNWGLPVLFLLLLYGLAVWFLPHPKR